MKQDNIMKLMAMIGSCILFFGCQNKKIIKTSFPDYSSNCLEHYATIPISELIVPMSYYWKLDSLGSNGYRRGSVKYLGATKIYDVNYDFVLENFGSGIVNPKFFKSDREHLYLVYYIFNTSKMGDQFKGMRIEDKIVFEFDTKTRKLISIRPTVS